MNKQTYDAMDADALGRVCTDPVFRQISGKPPEAKAQAISRLTPGQQALTMFRVLYNHASNSLTEYYCWMAYLQTQPNYWSGIVGALRFFGEASMVELIESARAVIEARNRKLGMSWENATYKDLEEDRELLAAMSESYARFQQHAAGTRQRIDSYIRTNSHQFIILSD